MTHTKGPWITYTDGNKRFIAPEHGKTNHAEVWGYEAEGDAVLMATAPELLEALEAILDYEDDLPVEGSFGDEVYQKAKKALAKAKGEIK